MKTITVLNSNTTHRIMHYVRLAFLSGASTAFLCHSGDAQPKPDHETAADNGSGKAFTYHYTAPAQATSATTVKYPASNTVYQLSKLTTGPSYKFNITRFVYNILPVNTVQYSDKSAQQMKSEAQMLSDNSDALSTQSKEMRLQAKQAGTRWLAVALCKKADSLDALLENKKFEASENSVNAAESQFEANEQQINAWQHNASYSSDLRTSANLLTQDADFYFTRSITEIQQSDSSTRLYVKQSFIESAQKDMETAVLKQQSAENIYISMENSKSVAIAEKIDSILATPDQATAAKDDPNAFGSVVFCVQVGSYSNIVPIDKANKLLKIAGLGITKHIENGVTIYTIGQYTSFTCADMLNQELVEDGYKEAAIVTYHQYGKEEPASKWVVATK